VDKKKRPDIKAFASNMQTPMPLGRKIYLAMKNNALKIIALKSCCGHPGEPGC